MIHLPGKELPPLPPSHFAVPLDVEGCRCGSQGASDGCQGYVSYKRSESVCMIGFSYTVRLDGCGLTGKATGPMIRSCRMAARGAAI